jgi:glutathione synthase/RimK-type ligase-like ATP-grasp enzyme
VRIALATCETLPELFTDDQMLMEALRHRGAEAFPLVWSSEEARESAPDLCVIRNTWDYYLRPERFITWAEGMASRSELQNPFPLLRWNHHKGYLLELAAKQLPVVPTILARKGRGMDVAALASAAAWPEVVVKPAISAGAYRTGRYRSEDPGAQAHLQELVLEADALIQPYLPSVEAYGERSFLFIDGELTHAVKRTQALTEGVGIERTMDRVTPTEEERRIAHAVMAALPMAPLYGRVDLAPDAEGRPLLMEVEVMEPRLFLQECPEALEKLADAILRKRS